MCWDHSNDNLEDTHQPLTLGHRMVECLLNVENNEKELWNASAGNVHEEHMPKTEKGLSFTGEHS